MDKFIISISDTESETSSKISLVEQSEVEQSEDKCCATCNNEYANEKTEYIYIPIHIDRDTYLCFQCWFIIKLYFRDNI